ncbi:MAG: ECF transporter S component [Clostridia bacterium]|nr:ECF transporter S component [Clostridia bacterium]
METFAVKNLTFRYPETGVDVLKNISFFVDKGEFVTLCGPSGCGKSTLLRNLKPLLAPTGIKSGEILFDGREVSGLSQREQSEKIGYVMQSPDNQLVTDKVWHELAFGLESLGLDNKTIRRRVAEAASFFGIQNLFDRSVDELSGGQKQLLNLASVMAMQPEVLILDEPTSQLDPIAASDFLAVISKINRELGTTVIITEHRLDEILPVSDRVLVMENGAIISDDTPQNTGINLKNQNSKTFLSLPSPMRIWDGCDGKGSCPVTVTQGRNWLENFAKTHTLRDLPEENVPKNSGKTSVELKEVWFRYEKNAPDVLRGLSMKVCGGEFVAVLGGNGAGKSTLLSILSGINTPYSGSVKVAENGSDTDIIAGCLPQDPQTLFVKKTVAEDLLEVFDGKRLDKKLKEKRLAKVIELCRLKELLNRHPYDLSGGEQQRAALAKLLLLRPKILLLDEPTKGLDAEFKAVFAEIVSTLCKSGVTVIMVSHDVEFCARYAHRCMLMFGGEIVSDGTPREFFSSNSFYVTSANRMSRGIINNAVTAEDVIFCCTGKSGDDKADIDFDLYDSSYTVEINRSKPKNPDKLPLWKRILGIFSAAAFVFGLVINLDYINIINSKTLPVWADFLVVAIPVALLMISFGTKSKRPIDQKPKKAKVPKHTVAAAAMILLAVPLTIFVGVVYLSDQKYMFISLLVMFECMLPFFLVFEGRKPQARELVIIAVLCAIAIIGRMAFSMLPQFKPVLALVIISGVAFGGESGFLVGAITMFVTSFFFQFGPWTPWQMFCAGIIGFLAGVLFRKGLLGRNRGALCVFGFISAIVIYGGIINFGSAVMAHAEMNLETIFSFYVTGFPFDIIHGVSTVVFLYFCAEPMLEKLDRIKFKYGLIS